MCCFLELRRKSSPRRKDDGIADHKRTCFEVKVRQKQRSSRWYEAWKAATPSALSKSSGVYPQIVLGRMARQGTECFRKARMKKFGSDALQLSVTPPWKKPKAFCDVVQEIRWQMVAREDGNEERWKRSRSSKGASHQKDWSRHEGTSGDWAMSLPAETGCRVGSEAKLVQWWQSQDEWNQATS